MPVSFKTLRRTTVGTRTRCPSAAPMTGYVEDHPLMWAEKNSTFPSNDATAAEKQSTPRGRTLSDNSVNVVGAASKASMRARGMRSSEVGEQSDVRTNIDDNRRILEQSFRMMILQRDLVERVGGGESISDAKRGAVAELQGRDDASPLAGTGATVLFIHLGTVVQE